MPCLVFNSFQELAEKDERQKILDEKRAERRAGTAEESKKDAESPEDAAIAAARAKAQASKNALQQAEADAEAVAMLRARRDLQREQKERDTGKRTKSAAEVREHTRPSRFVFKESAAHPQAVFCLLSKRKPHEGTSRSRRSAGCRSAG